MTTHDGSPQAPSVEVRLDPDFFERSIRSDVAEGLTASPKELPPKWFYDDEGSALYDKITRLDEYYPFRREREILAREATTMAGLGFATLVELGSGTSEKSRLLLDAMRAEGDASTLRRYVPFDVAEGFLRQQANLLVTEYPGLDVHAVVGDFFHHLDAVGAAAHPDGPTLVAFLGGTIGNLFPEERNRFFSDLVAHLRPGDGLLLGADLVKDLDRLVAAYDDASGVTAAFNLNVLNVVNRELGADFDPDRFEHIARWNPDGEWIEMLLRSTSDQTVRVRELGLDVAFADGELMRTEISSKFRKERLQAELAAAGLDLREWWTDEQHDFSLTLATIP